jgi:hypothetical protein
MDDHANNDAASWWAKRSRWISWMIALGILALAGVGVLRWTVGIGLVGTDSYPIIVTSRIDSWGDFVGTFTEPLMKGRYPFGSFYRPVLNLSFALDYAIWGVRAVGYQITDALLFLACAAAVYLATRRLVAAGSRGEQNSPPFASQRMGHPAATLIAPIVAMVLFLLHPSHVEVVPVAPRRAEMLCGLFLLLAIWAQLCPRRLAAKWPTVLPAVFALLAIGSKETGFLVVPLLFVAVGLFSLRRSILGRLRDALVAAILPGLVAAAMLGVRLAVLGEFGGHTILVRNPSIASAVGSILRGASIALCPQAVMLASPLRWAYPLLATALIAIVVITLRGPIDAHAASARRGLSAAALVGAFGVIWCVLMTGVTAGAGRIEPWYLFLPSIGLAIGCAAVVLAIGAAWSTSARLVGVGAAAVLTVIIVWQASYSPLIRTYPEWSQATAVEDHFLTTLHERIDAAVPGTEVPAPPLPQAVPAAVGKPTVYSAAMLMGYSVHAWADLMYPGRSFAVVQANAQRREVPPDKIRIVIPYVDPRYPITTLQTQWQR